MAILKPDLYYTDVFAIDLSDLRARGVNALLVDLDNTLLPRDTNVLPDELRRWAGRLAEEGFRVCLVSNNWHERVKRVAEELGFELVAKALKPLPFAFRRAMESLGASRGSTAVIGDQLFTDVLGGNALGLLTVLVAPLSKTDLPHTLLLRRIEALALAGRQPVSGHTNEGGPRS